MRGKKVYVPWQKDIDNIQNEELKHNITLKNVDLLESGFYLSINEYIRMCKEVRKMQGDLTIGNWNIKFINNDSNKIFTLKYMNLDFKIILDIGKLIYTDDRFKHESPYYYYKSRPFNLNVSLLDKKVRVNNQNYSYLLDNFISKLIDLINCYCT